MPRTHRPSPRVPATRHHHGRQRSLGRTARRLAHDRPPGRRAVNVCVDFCIARGVEALTLFAFSSENWGRLDEEVGADELLNALEREVDELDWRGVRVVSSVSADASPWRYAHGGRRARTAANRSGS
jgi:undecaprenyl diphosphate synthase